MNSRFDSWGDVRVFLSVLDTGSTLAASRKLGMSQPTVARRIDALEHALKLTLFERDTRGFRPTQEALALVEGARSIEAAAVSFRDKAARLGGVNTRPIRLTAPQTNFSDNLAAAIADFTAQNPGTRFEFVASYDCLDLAAGEADVAIRIAARIDDDRLICRKLTDVTASIYGSPAYAARHGLPSSPDEFAGHSFIVYDKLIASMKLNAWLLDRIDRTQIVSRCSEPESMIAAVRAGLGLGPVPTTLAEDDGRLIRCFEPPEGTNVTSWLVIGPDAYRRPEVRAFAAFFAPRFAEYIRTASQGSR